MGKLYQTVPGRSSNDPFTDHMWNVHLKANIAALIVKPAVRVNRIPTELTYSGGTTPWYQRPFPMNGGGYTVEIDTDGMFDGTTEGVQCTTAGVYHVDSTVFFSPDVQGPVMLGLVVDTRPEINDAVASPLTNIAQAHHRQFVNSVSVTAGSIVDLALLDQVQLRLMTITSVIVVKALLNAVWLGRSS